MEKQLETENLPVNLSVKISKTPTGQVVDQSLLVTIRGENITKVLSLYSSLKSRLNGDLDAPPNSAGPSTPRTVGAPKPKPQTNSLDYDDPVRQYSCDLCDSLLVKRIAKKGPMATREFWGCSKFPLCRYVLKRND